jgi:hypothetical protein
VTIISSEPAFSKTNPVVNCFLFVNITEIVSFAVEMIDCAISCGFGKEGYILLSVQEFTVIGRLAGTVLQANGDL